MYEKKLEKFARQTIRHFQKILTGPLFAPMQGAATVLATFSSLKLVELTKSRSG